MVIYLSDLNGSDRSGEWINAINRGGLWQVNEEVFQTFMIIEEIVREELCLEKCVYETKKAQIIEKVLTTMMSCISGHSACPMQVKMSLMPSYVK